MFLRYGDIKTVTLYVGEDRTAFQVHEDLLCEHSAVFKAPFGSNFREASDRTMSLPEDDAGSFEYLVHWLYTQRYTIPAPEEPAPTNSTKHYKFGSQALHLFVLADKYDVSGLKQYICVQLLEKAGDGYRPPHLSTIFYAYKNLPEKSSMREILADWYAPDIDPSWFVQDDVRIWLLKCPEFAVDLAAALAKRASTAERGG